jgi:hypothetical protein
MICGLAQHDDTERIGDCREQHRRRADQHLLPESEAAELAADDQQLAEEAGGQCPRNAPVEPLAQDLAHPSARSETAR